MKKSDWKLNRTFRREKSETCINNHDERRQNETQDYIFFLLKVETASESLFPIQITSSFLFYAYFSCSLISLLIANHKMENNCSLNCWTKFHFAPAVLNSSLAKKAVWIAYNSANNLSLNNIFEFPSDVVHFECESIALEALLQIGLCESTEQMSEKKIASSSK